MSAQMLLEALRREKDPPKSFFDLAVNRLGMDYSHAHQDLRRLECRGLVEVQRGKRGSPLIIRVVR